MGEVLPKRLFMTHGPARGGGVCLTFDDGPHPEYTPRLLDLLSASEVRATFFLVGQEAERFPGIVRRIADAGHLVGNHTFGHRDLTSITPAFLLVEVMRAKRLLGELTDQQSTFFAHRMEG